MSSKHGVSINFFEEYLEPENLSKIRFIKHNSILFLACRSLEEFQAHKRKIEQDHPHITAGYWPITSGSYWISPFTPTSELKRLKRELADIPSSTPVLIDLELPIRVRPYLRNVVLFCYHKRLLGQLRDLATSRALDMYYCERPSTNGLFLSGLRLLGAGFNPERHNGKILVMYYTSMIEKRSGRKGRLRVEAVLKKMAQQHPGRLVVGLGTTATGEMGNEPKLSPRNLERDIRFSKRIGAKEVFIFRLGGHDRRYQSVVEKFL